MNIPLNVKKLRDAANLTQLELANLIGVTSSMICQIERGTKALTLSLAIEITRALQCNLEELIK